MMIKRTLIASILALLFSQAAFAAEAGSAGGVTISDTDLTTLFRDNGVDIATAPEPAVEQNLRSELARRTIANEAKKAGLDKSPEVQRAMARAAEAELVRRYIASQAQPPADFPSEAELRTAYEQNKSKMVQPKRVRLAQIYLVGIDDATQKRALALDADLRAHPDNFADAAAKNGGDRASAASGTDWIPVANLPSNVSKAIENVAKGGVASVIPDKQGYAIVKVVDRGDEFTPTFDQVRPELVRLMREEKTRQLDAAYVAKLTAQYPATINTGVLARISAPGTTPAPSAAPAPATAAPAPQR